MRTHPIAVVGTEMYDNFYYVPPQEMTIAKLPEVTLQHWLDSLAARKQAEEELRESQVFLHTLLDAIPIPIFYKDREGRYLGFNRAFEAFFGQPRENLVGKSVFDINPPELAEIYHAQDNALLEKGGLQRYESQVEDTQGVLHDVIFHKAVFTDSQGTVQGLISLNRTINESFILFSARLRDHNVDVRFDLADDLPPIVAHSHKLEQVFLNLISNAEYAMEQKAAEEPGYQKVLEITTMATDGEVIATVCDNGYGIPEDVQERIFDPFFTTKPLGKGTGLGLFISYNIVASYDGEITCESIEGAGTVFTLRFPTIEKRDERGDV